jgi:hypothetical protein
MNQVQNVSVAPKSALTPIWAPDHCIIRDSSCRRTCDTKVSQLDAAILVRKNIRSFDVSVDYTLIVQIHEPLQDLRNIYGHEVLGELSKLFADIM